MDRRIRSVLVVSIALLMAFIASVAVYRAVQRIPVREVEVARYYVAVATQSIPAGTPLSADDVKLVPWPANSPVTGGHSTIEEVVNRGLLSSVVENEPLTESKLAPIEAGAGLPPSIPPGMRAMSVRVNEVIGVAGFVVPGTRVDVMVTMQQENDSIARTVVSNVQVLTAGTRTDQEQAKDGKPIPSTVVTLMVTPQDAERISLAQSEGQIMLTLRNPLDTIATETAGVRTGALFGKPAPPPVERKVEGRRMMVAAPPPAPAPEPPKAYTVETIRAAKRSEEVVR